MRFAEYAAAVVRRYGGRPLRTIGIYGPGIAGAPDILDGGALTCRVENLPIGEQGSEAGLGTVRAKLAAGSAIDAGDRASLILAPVGRPALL